MSHIQELQPLVDSWYNVYTDHTVFSPEGKLPEEVEEFLQATPRSDHRLEEGSDVVIVVLTTLRHEGFSVDDLWEMVFRKLTININREWVVNHNGTLSHRKTH